MITLTPDQATAEKSLNDFLNQSINNRIILTGQGGTGKSFLIARVMNNHMLSESHLPLSQRTQWYVTATTNKAKQALQVNISNMEVTTIQSLLGLGVYRGHLYQRNKPKLAGNKIVIVIDEASYIDYKLLGFINELGGHVKVIYLGDQEQLAPVKLENCPVFERGCPVVELTTLVRQSGAPLLAALCAEFKAYIKSGGTAKFPKVTLSNEIEHISSGDFEALIEDVFINNNGLPRDHRVLSYSNKVVNHHNERLFQLANGRTEMLPGDTVVNNNYAGGIKTDEEVIIVDKTMISTGIKDCSGHIYKVQGMFKSADLFVPYEPKKALKALEDILDDKVDNTDKREALKLYECLADLRPLYASTVHKAQGSTFKRVYIDLSSFKSVRSKLGIARLLYVAFSRASEKVYLTGDIR